MRYTTEQKIKIDAKKIKKAIILVTEGYSLHTTAKYLGFSFDYLRRKLDALGVVYKNHFTDKGE